MKKAVLISLLIAACGCASKEVGNTYGDIYNRAIKANTSSSCVKRGTVKEVESLVFKTLGERGYTRIIEQDPGDGYFVLWNPEVSRLISTLVGGFPLEPTIIVKLSGQEDPSEIRVDLVNGSLTAFMRDGVEAEIRAIVAELKRAQVPGSQGS